MLAIASIRKRQGLTQKELAEKVGTGEQQIGAWESGRRGERIERVVKLCRILQCEATTLNQRGVRALRKKAGLTVKELAAELDVSDRAVYAWENGESQIEGVVQAIALCRALECTTAELVTGMP